MFHKLLVGDIMGYQVAVHHQAAGQTYHIRAQAELALARITVYL